MTDQLIRRVRITSTDGSRYSLAMYDTGHVDERGRTVIAYRFGKVKAGPLFIGRDFCGSPMHADDSDATVAALLGFLTLRPGDTDAEYFETYTPYQLEWAVAHAEALALAVHDRFNR